MRNDVEEYVRAFADAGFTEVALARIGAGHQRPFPDWAGKSPVPELREL